MLIVALLLAVADPTQAPEFFGGEPTFWLDTHEITDTEPMATSFPTATYKESRASTCTVSESGVLDCSAERFGEQTTFYGTNKDDAGLIYDHEYYDYLFFVDSMMNGVYIRGGAVGLFLGSEDIVEVNPANPFMPFKPVSALGWSIVLTIALAFVLRFRMRARD